MAEVYDAQWHSLPETENHAERGPTTTHGPSFFTHPKSDDCPSWLPASIMLTPRAYWGSLRCTCAVCVCVCVCVMHVCVYVHMCVCVYCNVLYVTTQWQKLFK